MFEQVLGPDHFDIMPHLVAIGLAYILAFPIGWNREKSERSAGLRTFPLVAVASCGFIQAAESITADTPEAMATERFGEGDCDRRQSLDNRRHRDISCARQP